MEESIQFVVGAREAGQRLDEFLAARLTRLSRMRIAGLVARGACAVNGTEAHAGRRLGAGDSVEFAERDDGPNAMTPEAMPLEIVYEDEQLIVVVKPAGLLVHPTRGVKSGTLANALTYHLNGLRIAESETDGETEGRGDGEKETTSSNISPSPFLPVPPSLMSAIRIPHFIRPGIVHRLDRDTSGLMVVAKTQSALSRLTQHFQRRLVEKRYLAVVSGRVEQQEQTIVAPIGRDEDARPRWRVLRDGKPAETRLRVLHCAPRRTLVELEPVTGRTNQLRIHCAHIGHPIVGDSLHGGDDHARLCLHAARLAFRHPATNEWAEFSSEMPAEFSAALGGDGASYSVFSPRES
ncbi:MAG TPA: RluA family pseudouridine synthase [Pyrinomonadaceae bacterium]|nr:RluA family pseudouridine synthase [Pyrinomonadaceae bacterium]